MVSIFPSESNSISVRSAEHDHIVIGPQVVVIFQLLIFLIFWPKLDHDLEESLNSETHPENVRWVLKRVFKVPAMGIRDFLHDGQP